MDELVKGPRTSHDISMPNKLLWTDVQNDEPMPDLRVLAKAAGVAEWTEEDYICNAENKKFKKKKKDFIAEEIEKIEDILNNEERPLSEIYTAACPRWGTLDPMVVRKLPCEGEDCDKPFIDGWERSYMDDTILDIRKEWVDRAKDKNLFISGMPMPVQAMVTGEIDKLEVEITSYNKLAGLKWKTSKHDLEKEAKKLKDMCWKIMSAVDTLVSNYKQIEVE